MIEVLKTIVIFGLFIVGPVIVVIVGMILQHRDRKRRHTSFDPTPPEGGVPLNESELKDSEHWSRTA